MDTIRADVSPLTGFVRPIDQVRLWVNGVNIAHIRDRVGPEPQELLSASAEARRTGKRAEVIVARCSNCLDGGCGYTVAEISDGPDSVSWEVFEVWQDMEPHRELESTFQFERSMYDDVMETIAASDSR